MPPEETWRVEDTVRLAPLLAAHGVDLLDVSAYGNSPHQTVLFSQPGYQVPFSEAVKRTVKDTLLVSAVGSINSGTLAQDILDKVCLFSPFR